MHRAPSSGYYWFIASILLALGGPTTRAAEPSVSEVLFRDVRVFDAQAATTQGTQLAKMVRWYTPAEVLRMATADNAELLALSDLRSPYEGRVGVVESGALADLLLVEGDPIADINLIAEPAKSFFVIM